MPSLIPDVTAFERRLAGLPVVKHPAHEVVLTAGSKTGRLLFLRSGAVEVIKDGVQIANVSAPARCSAIKPSSWTSPIRQT
jgi:CRP/FNR family transcriptional regulator, cyclic AMP receptor protein